MMEGPVRGTPDFTSGDSMKTLCVLALTWLCAASASAGQFDFPAGFAARDIATNGTSIHVRVGGKGPAVVLLHGYGESGDMWVPMAADLARDHTVIVPDLRGMGLSAKPAGGFDKKNQAADVAGVLDALKIERASFVTHDIGNMVGFAYVALHRNRVTAFFLVKEAEREITPRAHLRYSAPPGSPAPARRGRA